MTIYYSTGAGIDGNHIYVADFGDLSRSNDEGDQHGRRRVVIYAGWRTHVSSPQINRKVSGKPAMTAQQAQYSGKTSPAKKKQSIPD